jgi:DNA-binding NarL/FixJ family response regulator
LRALDLRGEDVEQRLAMSPRHRSHLSVLVVDDSLPMRAHLRALLNQEPGLCLAAEADNGADAVESFFRYRPDIVLLDVCLPDRNGFEVMQCFKQAAPSCAVILLSDAPDPCVDEVSHLLGATEVCHKASELNRLREVLRRLVQEQSAVPA